MNSEWLLYVCVHVHVGWLPQYLKQASRYRFAPSLLPSLFSPPFSSPLFCLPFHLFSPLFLPFPSSPHPLHSSNAYDYDVFISTSSIGRITALHRSIISSLEVSLTDKQVRPASVWFPDQREVWEWDKPNLLMWWSHWVCSWTENALIDFDINVIDTCGLYTIHKREGGFRNWLSSQDSSLFTRCS